MINGTNISMKQVRLVCITKSSSWNYDNTAGTKISKAVDVNGVDLNAGSLYWLILLLNVVIYKVNYCLYGTNYTMKNI